LEREHSSNHEKRNADRQDGRIEDDSSPCPLPSANGLLVQKPFSRLRWYRDETNQFRHRLIEVLLVYKFIGAVLTRDRGPHGTINQMVVADWRAIQESAAPS
jgi:hypothetical protein